MAKAKLYSVDGDPQDINELEVTNLVVTGILTATSWTLTPLTPPPRPAMILR